MKTPGADPEDWMQAIDPIGGDILISNKGQFKRKSLDRGNAAAASYSTHHSNALDSLTASEFESARLGATVSVNTNTNSHP